MRTIALIAFIALVLGCAGLESKLCGKYKSSVRAKKEGKDIGDFVVEALGNALLSGSLELKPDRTYEMAMMGMPLSGTWEIATGRLRLTPEELVGVKAKDKDRAVSIDIKPMEFEISDDATTLTALDGKLGKVVFIRETVK